MDLVLGFLFTCIGVCVLVLLYLFMELLVEFLDGVGAMVFEGKGKVTRLERYSSWTMLMPMTVGTTTIIMPMEQPPRFTVGVRVDGIRERANASVTPDDYSTMRVGKRVVVNYYYGRLTGRLYIDHLR